MYTASPMYASPAMPQMASATPYYNGPSPYTPVMATHQTPGMCDVYIQTRLFLLKSL
jgi:hypothetical protein